MSTGVSHFSQVQMERMTPTKKGGNGKICCFPVIRGLFLESFFLSKPRWYKLITRSFFKDTRTQAKRTSLSSQWPRQYRSSFRIRAWLVRRSFQVGCVFSGCGEVKWTTLRYKGPVGCLSIPCPSHFFWWSVASMEWISKVSYRLEWWRFG